MAMIMVGMWPVKMLLLYVLFRIEIVTQNIRIDKLPSNNKVGHVTYVKMKNLTIQNWKFWHVVFVGTCSYLILIVIICVFQNILNYRNKIIAVKQHELKCKGTQNSMLGSHNFLRGYHTYRVHITQKKWWNMWQNFHTKKCVICTH